MSDLLNSASLVMIPSGYKEDVVYSQIPTDGSGDLSFTRASNGTRINSAGLVEVCPWNLAGYSEDFSNAYWTKTNLSVSANSTTAPNGTTTADTLTTTAITQCQLIAGYNFLVGDYTLSFYVKKVDLGFTYVELGNAYCWVNLTTGAITGASQFGSGWTFVSASASSVGDGWFKVDFVASCSIAGSYQFRPLHPVPTSGQYDSLATNKATYLWGAQLNIGSTAKPYFPTTDRLNVPRLTYQNGGGGCPSLLLEKQSTNLALYSEQFDNAAWTKPVSTITANDIISPDGTQNADRLNAVSSSGIYQLVTNATGIYTQTIYAKQGTNRYFGMSITSTATNRYVVYFDLQAGTVYQVYNTSTPLTNTSNSITAVGNGWYRCQVTGSCSGDIYAVYQCTNTTPFTLDAVGDLTNGSNGTIYLWGCQLEQSSYATSLINTTSSSATRVADACFKTGISSLIGQTEGTLFIDMVPTDVSGLGRYMNIFNSSNVSNGWNAIISQGATPNTFRFYGDGFDFSGGACLFGVRVKVALAYKNGVLTSAYVNGASVGTLTAVTTGKSYNQLTLGQGPFGNEGSCNVNESIIFPTALTNAELASLTTI